MPFDPKDGRNLVIALGLGALTGAAAVQSHHDGEAKSQAEKDDEEGCEWLCDLIWKLLHEWESEPCETEKEYNDDLVEYLRDELADVEAPDDGRRIKVARRVRTDLGVPDVLIDDRLVLELKLGSHEGLGDHFKTGHRGSLQNRPTDHHPGRTCFTLPAGGLASPV